MHRTTIMLPHSLKLDAQRLARKRGVSLGDLVRESLASFVGQASETQGRDPLFADEAVWEGETPGDLSENHDAYLYGEES